MENLDVLSDQSYSATTTPSITHDPNKINCPFCDHLNDVMKAYKREDSIARGSVFICLNSTCKKKFYSWISDGYQYGHEKEYKTTISKSGTAQVATK